MLKGLDCSHWQGNINWDAVKASVDFAIIKTSEGSPDPGQTASQYRDASFLHNRDEARRVGLLRGFYHFGRPDANNAPEAEAQCFYDNIGGIQTGELLILDIEVAWSGDYVGWSKRFLDHLASLANGCKGLIYLNQSQTASHDWTSVINGNYGLWLARYDNNPFAPMWSGTPWPFLAMRQYTDKANIAGISSVDADVFYGDVPTFLKYGYAAPAVNPTPPPVLSTGDSATNADLFKNIYIAYYSVWPTDAQVSEYNEAGGLPYTFFQTKYLYPDQAQKAADFAAQLATLQAQVTDLTAQLKAFQDSVSSDSLEHASTKQILLALVNKQFPEESP